MTPPLWLKEYQDYINHSLSQFFAKRYWSSSEWVEKSFEEAIFYALEGSGKRIRPILTMIAYETTTKKKFPEEYIPVLLGLECIHAFTLVHDDLPSMDNDELRRGKPTVWKKYGETLAILVGDGLQTLGFELLSEPWDIRIIREMARTLWDFGITRGQVCDTLLTQNTLTLTELFRLHDEKTWGFIETSLVIGCFLWDTSSEDIVTFRQIGKLLGRAFQIQDDILDYEGDAALLGKNTSKDIALGKGIVALVGIDESKKTLSDIHDELQNWIEKVDNPKMWEIADFIIARKQ